jgi:cyclopropane-fatty-acyl-phospholipid synthase
VQRSNLGDLIAALADGPRGFEVKLRDASHPTSRGEVNALSLGEAYICGAIDIEGDLEAAYRQARSLLKTSQLDASAAAPSGETAGASERELVDAHYGLPIEFWKPWLGPSMLYTCAYFEDAKEDLTKAQYRKVDRICEKLQLSAADTLLDIGCGWGALSVRAAQKYGARVVGVTLTELQAEHARRLAAEAGVQARCTIMVANYRELEGQRFDKIAAVGISEHVGGGLLHFFRHLLTLLVPGGLLLNQGIVHSPQANFLGGREFIERFIFPGALLRTIAEVLAEGERATFEVVDVESLSAHYVLTLRAWLERIREHEREVQPLVGERRYREFLAYLAGFACEFDLDSLRVYQTLMRSPSGATRAAQLSRRV